MFDTTNISAISLAAVLILIAVRQLGEFKLQIWQIMLLGALSVLIFGATTPEDAAYAINLDVMVFLGGMFVIGEAMQESGYLIHLFNRLFCRAKNLDQLLLLILFAMGFLSALLMNDTLAIIGTPFMLYLARTLKISPKLLLLTLAFAVTTGSALSPIGNPQNLLIAINGNLANPFLVFLQVPVSPDRRQPSAGLSAAPVILQESVPELSLADLPGTGPGPRACSPLPDLGNSADCIDIGKDRSRDFRQRRRIPADLYRSSLGPANHPLQREKIGCPETHRLEDSDLLCLHVRPYG